MLGVDAAPVTVDGSVVVGYFPRVTETELKENKFGASDGLVEVGFAMAETLKCLRAAGVVVRGQLEMTPMLTVTEGTTTKRIKLPTAWPAAFGVYLFSPGKTPRRVAAQEGPSSLATLAPDAAAAYFQTPTCKRP